MTMSQHNVVCLGLVILCVVFSGTLGSHWKACPIGWVSYQKEVPNTCLYVSDNTASTLAKAHETCVEKNASLIVIQSEEKMNFFKDIIQKYLSTSTKIWIGLQKHASQVTWLTKDGLVPANSLPSGMRFSNWYSSYGSSYNINGLIYISGSLRRYDNVYNRGYTRFICEKRVECAKGFYGLGCDKECHCYSQECNSTALEITCDYGCQVGWMGMGKGCSQPKEDADIKYFCVNSEDQGKYAHVRINTKGVTYENIHALDEDSHIISWCNNTTVQTDNLLSTVTIKIFTDNSTDESIQEGSCAGKIGKNGKYEWKIKIQEKQGIVSRNDQEVVIECDFSGADPFLLSADTEITRERWFRRSDIKKPVNYLKEKKEKIELLVVDPSTGKKVSETQIGSPVVLRINYGLGDDNIATGVHPYNCYASSIDGEQKGMFLDDKGCPLQGFPISEFSRNGTTKSLITKPFPLFGFGGTEEIDFHCSYVPCFGDEPCRANCDDAMHIQQNTTNAPGRQRRSTSNVSQKIRGTISITN